MMSVGVQTWGTDWPALRAYWLVAERLGYDRITYGDGLGGWTHAGWSALGALAVLTTTARIGPAVTYCFDAAAHHPSWLAKHAVTVDHLSGGRLDLRLGVGAEDPGTAELWGSHGIPYPDAGARVEILEEGIQVISALWSGAPVDFSGRAFTLKRALLLPRPLQSPRPPIWVAAMGPGALRLAASRADGWEASYLTPASFAEKWQRLQGFLQPEGRDPGTFRRSVEADVILGRDGEEVERWRERFCRQRAIGPEDPLLETALIGEAGTITEQITRYRRAGATDLMLGFADFPQTGMLELFAHHILRALRSA